jgi:hypothetical protein
VLLAMIEVKFTNCMKTERVINSNAARE